MLSKRLAVIAAAFALLSSFALMPVVHASPSAYAGAPKLGPMGAKHLHVVGPNSYYCDPGWIYENISGQGRSMYALFSHADYNGTPYNATAKFITSVTGTVSVTAGGGVNVDANVIVAGVKASINASVTVSISVSGTNEMDITVPPYKTGYGQYGVWRQVAYGHYYYLMSNSRSGQTTGM